MTYGVPGIDAAGENGLVTLVRHGSSANRAGILPGDVIEFAPLTLSERMRLLSGKGPAGSTITVRIRHAQATRTVTLRAEPLARAAPPDRIASTLFNCTVTLCIVGLIVLRRPAIATACLVLFALGGPQVGRIAVEFSWIPDPFFGAVTVAVTVLVGPLPLFALLPFIVRFPRDPRTPQGRRLAGAADGIFGVSILASLWTAIYEPVTFKSWPAYDVGIQFAQLGVVLFFTTMVYRANTGEDRRRVSWVLAGLIFSAVTYVLYDVAVLYMNSRSAVLVDLGAAGPSVLAIALGYSVLRHRVLDIGFALNRTMVYGVMTALVVVVVSLVDFITGRLLSEQRLALAIEALITIGFGFALNWIHARTEELVDRVVFRARHLAEKRIEYRMGALGYAATSDAVDEALALEAPQILDLYSAAIFCSMAGSQQFVRKAASGWPEGTAGVMDAGALLVRTLRSLERPIVLDDAAIRCEGFPVGLLRPALAIPINAQHDLIGFALFGNHTGGALPDPEEIALLQRLCNAAGVAYGAVEARQWRERVIALEQTLVPQQAG